MPAFAYRAMTHDGRIVKGREEAISSGRLEQELRQRGLLTLDIDQVEATNIRRRGLLVSRRTDVTDFITTFAALLQAGLSLDKSLEVSGRGAVRSDVANAISTARRRVREGGRLSDAIAARPDLFPSLAVGLIRAAEGGGQLAEAVGRLSSYLERDKSYRSKVTSALIYPILLCSAGGITVAVLLLFVIPKFGALLADAGSELPGSTAFLIAFSSMIAKWFPFIIIAMITAVIWAVAWRNSANGRARLHALLLAVPFLGDLRARHATTRFGHTLSTLLAGGMPLVNALEVARDSVGDAAISAHISLTGEAVRRGESFSVALGRGGLFPYAFIRLVEVGEETGDLDTMVNRAATLMEGELERRLERLVMLLEPSLIILFAGVVGFVALALLQAVYGIQTQVN